jgi:hypothetical protein
MARSKGTEPEPIWRVRADLLSTKALLWVAGAGRGGEPTPDVHLFLYDRYWRLAVHHEQCGHKRRAERFRSKAELHYRLSGHDGPPFAAAMAVARPRGFLHTHAAASPSDDSDDAA